MKYLIHTRYCWYDSQDGEKLVFMYFIQNVPFTFDELPEIAKEDLEIVTLADQERRWKIEDLYKAYSYSINYPQYPITIEHMR